MIRAGRGIRAQPARLYSAGGLGSSALRSMGITPPGPKFAHLRPAVLGASLGAFHGGMAETDIIRRRLPAVVADFSAAYPTVARLIGAWDVLRAERVESEDVTSELAAWLTELGTLPLPDLLDALIDPVTWRRWGSTVALVRPEGAWLQHRRRKGNGEYTSCMGPLSFDGLLPYSWCDLAASVVTSNNMPYTAKAWRAMPHGIEKDLHAVTFPGGMVFDPNDQDVDFFAFLLRFRRASRDDASLPPYAQLRRERTAKVMGSSTSYGNLARYDRPLVEAKTDTVSVLDPWGEIFESSTLRPEQPGPDSCPMLAASVTAGCRLVMALLRRAVAECGGQVAAILTDAAVIPASTSGGLVTCPGAPRDAQGAPGVRLLPRSTLTCALELFDPLGLDGVPAFKLIHGTASRDLDVTVYGRNRYLVIDPETDEIVHNSEFGLGGVFADPAYGEGQLADGRRRWVAEAGTVVATSDSGTGPLPLIRIASFGQAMAVSPFTIATPDQAQWFDDDVRPFTRALAAHESRSFTAVESDDETHGAPVALFDPDPKSWPHLDWRWRDRSPARPLLYPGAVSIDRSTFVPKRIDDVVGEWCQGIEPGALPPDGQRSRTARGLLTRIPAEGLPVVDLLGREGANLVERQAGVVRPDEVQTIYRSTMAATTIASVDGEVVRQMVKVIGLGEVAGFAGVSRQRLARLLEGRPTSQGTGPVVVAALLRRARLDFAIAGARSDVLEAPPPVVFAVYLTEAEKREASRRCALPACELPALPKGQYCSEAHQQASSHRRLRALRSGGVRVFGHARHAPRAKVP